MDTAFTDVERVLREVTAGVSPGSTAQEFTTRALRERITLFARSVVRLRVVLSGRHKGSITNQRMLIVRKREGRDFDAWTVQFKQSLQRDLFALYEPQKRVPSLDELATSAGPIARAFLVQRVERGGFDLLLEPLTTTYAQRKRRDGYGGRPIGERTGAWLSALRKARVTFVTN